MSDPQALHTELLAKIDEERIEAYGPEEIANPSADTLAGALEAVLKPHKPEQHYSIGQDNRRTPSYHWCPACRCIASKCRTVKVIASALGVVADG